MEYKILEKNDIDLMDSFIDDSDTKYQEYKTQVLDDINKVRDKVDLLMVAMHWGVEYTHTPTAYQEDIAQFLSDNGVDIIIGTHPHVIMPVTFINNTLVIYSLGNFVSSQVGVERLTGLMASLTIKKDVYHGKTTISIEDVYGDLVYTNKSNKYVVYPYKNLTNNILSNYQSYYTKYGNIVTAYNKNVKMKGI